MIARLGNVLYWTGCIFAVLIASGGALMAHNDTFNPGGILTLFLVIAGIVWAVGRACLYILAGR
jgi:hypothetical protein